MSCDLAPAALKIAATANVSGAETVLPNVSLYKNAPGLVDAFRSRGDEIFDHGVTNSQRQGDLAEDQERELIELTTRTVIEQEGKHPRGWLGPWISESPLTPDLLDEAGYQFVLDWSHDEQPIWIKTRSGRILSAPYPQEINDVPQILGRQHNPAEFCAMLSNAFEVQFSEAGNCSSVFGIAIHPYLMGQPNRFHDFSRTLRAIVKRFDQRI